MKQILKNSSGPGLTKCVRTVIFKVIETKTFGSFILDNRYNKLVKGWRWQWRKPAMAFIVAR